jgi:hypothetical protein
MADDWEADDWEAEDYKPALPTTTSAVAPAAAVVETTGTTLLAKINEPDMSKFEGEDEGAEPEPEHSIKPQVRVARRAAAAAGAATCTRALVCAPMTARTGTQQRRLRARLLQKTRAATP